MSGSRTLFTVVALVALLVMTLAAPVAAAKTKLAVVNGIPGMKVDVCVNGREIKSGLRYGKFRLTTTRTAKAKIKFFKRDRRTCRGKLIAKRWVGLADATVVITKHAPKVVVFDNSDVARPILASQIRVGDRHAADIGPADFSQQGEWFDPLPVSPVAARLKGDQHSNVIAFGDEPGFYAVLAHLVGTDMLLAVFAKAVSRNVRRWEQILVGTNVNNTRFVHIDRRAKLAPWSPSARHRSDLGSFTSWTSVPEAWHRLGAAGKARGAARRAPRSPISDDEAVLLRGAADRAGSGLQARLGRAQRGDPGGCPSTAKDDVQPLDEHQVIPGLLTWVGPRADPMELKAGRWPK